jgi:hypothetical protein
MDRTTDDRRQTMRNCGECEHGDSEEGDSGIEVW